MIKTLISILFIIIIQILIFVFFPDNGKYGNYFFYGSIALWSFLFIYLKLNFKLFNIFPMSLIFNILFFGLMILITTIILPQEDGKTILSKIIKRDFPDSDTINRGKIKYLNGIFTETHQSIDTLKKETERFFKTIKSE